MEKTNTGGGFLFSCPFIFSKTYSESNLKNYSEIAESTRLMLDSLLVDQHFKTANKMGLKIRTNKGRRS